MVAVTRFSRLTAVTFVLLFLIVLSGAAVRLTGSGLGCEVWPNCDRYQVIEAWDYHRSIEFGNRLITGAVGLVCVAQAVAAHRLSPKRRDLIAWSWAIAVGVGIQGLIGRYSVTTHLHPLVVAAHFLGSPVLLWMALVAWVRSTRGPVTGPVPSGLPLNHSRLTVAMAAAVLAVGTLTTGTGPHAGDETAERLTYLSFTAITRLHSLTAWAFLAVLVALALRLARSPHRPEPAFTVVRWLVVAALAQGAIGYYQYFNGVPPAVVELHILGSMTVWCLAVLAHLHLFDQARSADPIDLTDSVDPAQSSVPLSAP